MKKTYSTEEAAKFALKWCEKNNGWERICDISCDSEELYYSWSEITKKEKDFWIKEYGVDSAKDAWKEFGNKKCKIPYGFITGKGEFYSNILDVPLNHSIIMVYQTGKLK